MILRTPVGSSAHSSRILDQSGTSQPGVNKRRDQEREGKIRRVLSGLGTFLAFGFLVACSAALVPATNDPAKKLSHAKNLLNNDRPLPAERLIGESMEIYRARNDGYGLAIAHYDYATFLSSDVVGNWESTWFRENGFRNTSADYGSRFEEAANYFELAAKGFVDSEKFDDAANAYLDLALKQSRNGNRDLACLAFDDSLNSYRAYQRKNPNSEIRGVLEGYDSFEDMVLTVSEGGGC